MAADIWCLKCNSNFAHNTFFITHLSRMHRINCLFFFNLTPFKLCPLIQMHNTAATWLILSWTFRSLFVIIFQITHTLHFFPSCHLWVCLSSIFSKSSKAEKYETAVRNKRRNRHSVSFFFPLIFVHLPMTPDINSTFDRIVVHFFFFRFSQRK